MNQKRTVGQGVSKVLALALGLTLGLGFYATCGCDKKDGHEQNSSRTVQQPQQTQQPAAGATARPTAKRIPPADHTKNKDDVMHKPGAKRESATCIPCHGQDLKGGDVAPSCYSCHDREWK